MLRVEGLRAGYGPLDVLHDVSFEAPSGAIVAILGANGAGKTTLLRALTGLIRARGGSVSFAGERIERLPAEQRVRRGLALVPEGRELFNTLTVRENLTMGAFTRRASRAEIEQDIARVLDYFPRLRERMEQSAASLSGGEGQMLAIGRALMARPKTLLLDEPSLGLAPAIVDTVFDVIQQLHREQGLTVLLVEQNARKALGIATSAYVLQGGAIALHGATDELARSTAVRDLYLGGEGYSQSATSATSATTLEPGTPANGDAPDTHHSQETGAPHAMNTPLMAGVSASVVETPRLRTHMLTAGDPGGTPVVLVHGNVSSSRFFEETMLALPPGYWVVAPDLRGFGESETKPVDATRGVGDFSDDLRSFMETLELTGARRPHLLGWSLGGGVVMQYAIEHAADIASLTMIDPMSPFGFGGTKDTAGTPCWPDAAGSGGGTANPDYVKRLREGDRGEDSANSPRAVMNAFYFKPPFRVPPVREDVFVEAMLQMKVGDGNYPGDMETSENWPGVRPGKTGVNNAISARLNLGAFGDINPQPPVLWIRGADDQIVSDSSFLDFGTLGELGYVPDYPGEEVYPSQPMVSQMRAVLDRYAANGGRYTEVVVADCGHSPHIEKPEEFRKVFFALLAGE
ncbi:MAG TPA: alpha/beta fold hydrolase [Ktedonobacterales bacterium]|nr:alpha/beta fold hydrolase [Ktedonobacterales bacterium]